MPRDPSDETAIRLHPVAELFPMMPEDELQSLADDIKKRGLLVPIVVDSEGAIVDGRHRALACRRAGVEPQFSVAPSDDLDDLIELVASLNAKRRNISLAQRAIAAAEAWGLIEVERGRPSKNKEGKNSHLNGRRTDRLGASYGVNRKYIEQARFVLLNEPVGAAEVKSGDKVLKDAFAEAKDKVDAKLSRVALLAEVRTADPELAALVVDKKLTLAAAVTELRERKETVRLRHYAAMKNLHTVMSLLSPHGGDPAPIVEDYLSNWDAEQFPQGTVKLSINWLKACKATLDELIKSAEQEAKP